MKLKNIILLAHMFVLGFTACTSEIPVDNPEATKSGDLSVVFAVNAPTTKVSEGDTPATEPEKTISDFHVAIFNSAGERIACKDLNTAEGSEDLTTTTYDNKDAYQVHFSDLSIKSSPVFAIVIANAKDYTTANFSNYKTYENYLVASKNGFAPIVQTQAFEAGKLVKFGKSNPVTLVASNQSIQISVPLTQLTLRVDFEGVQIKSKAADTRAAVQETVTYSVIGARNAPANVLSAIKNAVGSLSGLTWTPNTSRVYEEDDSWITNYYTQWKSGLFDAGYYSPYKGEYKRCGEWYGIYYERNAYYRSRVLIVTKTTKSESEGEEAYEYFHPTAVSYSGVNHKSDIAIFDNTGLENSQQDYQDQYISLNIDKGLPVSFYTYENTEALTLKIEGYYDQSEGSEGSSSTTVKYGYLLQSRPNGGWSNADLSEASIKQQENNIKWVNVPTKAVTKGVTVPAGAKLETYYLNLNKLQNNKLVKGNIYSVTGSYTPSHEYPVTPEINWEVKEIKTHDVIIPGDTFE
ncbi:MAG: hypothetical protein LUH63_06445 [Parabacteroides sp.]|nr:hypothetical protein [Parabacteroides sp.]